MNSYIKHLILVFTSATWMIIINGMEIENCNISTAIVNSFSFNKTLLTNRQDEREDMPSGMELIHHCLDAHKNINISLFNKTAEYCYVLASFVSVLKYYQSLKEYNNHFVTFFEEYKINGWQGKLEEKVKECKKECKESFRVLGSKEDHYFRNFVIDQFDYLSNDQVISIGLQFKNLGAPPAWLNILCWLYSARRLDKAVESSSYNIKSWKEILEQNNSTMSIYKSLELRSQNKDYLSLNVYDDRWSANDVISLYKDNPADVKKIFFNDCGGVKSLQLSSLLKHFKGCNYIEIDNGKGLSEEDVEAIQDGTTIELWNPYLDFQLPIKGLIGKPGIYFKIEFTPLGPMTRYTPQKEFLPNILEQSYRAADLEKNSIGRLDQLKNMCKLIGFLTILYIGDFFRYFSQLYEFLGPTEDDDFSLCPMKTWEKIEQRLRIRYQTSVLTAW